MFDPWQFLFNLSIEFGFWKPFTTRSDGSKLDKCKLNKWCVWERCWRFLEFARRGD